MFGNWNMGKTEDCQETEGIQLVSRITGVAQSVVQVLFAMLLTLRNMTTCRRIKGVPLDWALIEMSLEQRKAMNCQQLKGTPLFSAI
jgi:hypothetical protein